MTDRDPPGVLALAQAKSIQFRWVEVLPVPPVEKPPCPLWTVRITKPEWLDGGHTWLDSVDFHDINVAVQAAAEVDEAMEAVWQLRLTTMTVGQNVYAVASSVSSTLKDGVTWRAERDQQVPDSDEIVPKQ